VPADLPIGRETRVGRRAILLSAGLGLLAFPIAACTSSPSSSTPTSSPGADDALRQSVATDELRLVAMYAAAGKAQPSLTGVLKVGARHSDYAAAVANSAAIPAAAAVRAPSGAAATLTWLQNAERVAAAARSKQCANAADQQLARTLALIGSGCIAAAGVLGQARHG
jgi:hypothetical protein